MTIQQKQSNFYLLHPLQINCCVILKKGFLFPSSIRVPVGWLLRIFKKDNSQKKDAGRPGGLPLLSVPSVLIS